jgi:hypothetical protein
MRLKRIISGLVMAAGLSLGLLLQTMPAASAAPSAHTAAIVHARPSSSHIRGPIPLIKTSTCPGQTTTWVLITRFELSGGSVFNTCFGFTGTWKFTDTSDFVSFFCSGNNSGSFTYSVNGVAKGFKFGPGKKENMGTAPNVPRTLTITGWSGNDKCTV